MIQLTNQDMLMVLKFKNTRYILGEDLRRTNASLSNVLEAVFFFEPIDRIHTLTLDSEAGLMLASLDTELIDLFVSAPGASVELSPEDLELWIKKSENDPVLALSLIAIGPEKFWKQTLESNVKLSDDVREMIAQKLSR